MANDGEGRRAAAATAKEAAGRRAAEMVQDGMVVGLGTGSTAAFAIRALGERVRTGLRITAVSSSVASEVLAREVGIPVRTFADVRALDITIDGADEVDPRLQLIKGGGGALVREKLVAAASREMIVVADAGKCVETLGAFPLPIAIFPFAWQTTLARIQGMGHALLRERCAAPFLTDDGLYIVDLSKGTIPDPEALAAALHATPGVADVGLFLNLATKLVVGYEDGHTEVRMPVGCPSG
jgi:ribose 5-phosphate isomerase A